MNSNTGLTFPLAAIAAALLSAYGPAWAQDNNEIRLLTKPESAIRLGAGYLSDDAPRFGQYTGVREKGGYGLLDVDIVKRNDATGTWFKVRGRNLGLDDRDLRITHERQGDWAYYLDYSQTPRYEPLTVNTGLVGLGTTTQIIRTAAPRSDVQLKTQREAIGLGISKQLGSGFDIQLRASTEEKEGARLWGFGPITPNFLTEPIDSTTRQVEAIVAYSQDKLQLSGGYYGSSYTNRNAALNVISVAANGVAGAPAQLALPQDNQSHQVYLTGGYGFTPTTRGTFKVSSTRSTQNESFFKAPTFPPSAGNTTLNGKVDTTLAQMGITSRPMPKLSLLANLRYEDRDDKTPRVQYLSPTPPTPPAQLTRDGFNVPMSRTQLTGKAEASYLLPIDLRLTGGVDAENIKRGVSPTLRQLSWREKTDERSYRLELRRSMSETLNGAIAYVHSKRGGSPFLEANNGFVVVGGVAVAIPDVIDPIHWADRKRDKTRLSMDWAPTEKLSLQLVLDDAHDAYDSPSRPLGPESGKARLYSLDASYAFSEEWQASAWVSRDENHINQSTRTGPSTIVPAGVGPGGFTTWQAQLSSVGNALGFGVRGKASSRIQIGADLQYQKDVNKYGVTSLSPATGSLPDIYNKLTSLKLFGIYALQKNSSIRLDYVFDHRKSDDWTYQNWTYADGTTVSQNSNQKVQFIGISYIYKFL